MIAVIWALIPPWLKIGAGAALVALVLCLASYHIGKRDERSQARSVVLESTIETLRERKLTDESIQSMDDAGLCAALNGVLTDGRCE